MKKMMLAISFVSLQLFALEANDVLDMTIKQYQNMNSFYAEFEQVYCDEEAGICQRYEGKTYYMRPNFFRMEIDEPRQIYVGDSVSLWIYMPDEKRAIRQKLEQMPFQINPDVLFKDYKDDYDAQITIETDDHYEIALTPTGDTDIYRKLTIRINKVSFEIISIAVLDEAGVESKFEFSNVEINKKISRKMFEFNPPEGIQIDEF